MQKTQYTLTPYKKGRFDEAIFKMILSHNEGIANIDLDILQAYCMAEHARFPLGLLKPKFVTVPDEGKLYIYEGEELVLFIQEKIQVGSLEIDEMEEDLKREAGGGGYENTGKMGLN